MGKQLKLQGVKLTDPNAPTVLTRDRIESKGSLFLFDGNHQFSQFAGLPVAGASVPNALSDKAAALLGVEESATSFIVQPLPIPQAGVFKAERTGRGGIHGLITQAGAQTTRQCYFLRASTAVQEYMRDNPTHTFYVSIWQTITRKAVTGSPSPQAPFFFVNGVSSTANYRFHFEGSLFSPRAATATYRGGKAIPTVSDTEIANETNRFTSVAVQGNTGNGPVSADPVTFGVGSEGVWAGPGLNKAASRIIYRVYVEDLTVSGRSYEAVEAIDLELYTEAFAAGGKFFGDTYTAVSTMP